ncbi:Transcription factor spt8 [Gnomoniopsis smithogilvyi]|uniref:Transcription factor spt8 n=1 Tax=Gnomoniopsis smithogilvyi TaxID=1191159 RepID=A0A9W8YK31_9PEZI|nr:Transcription factor spt8 [Gnomoniopsis smithogilvyi]
MDDFDQDHESSSDEQQDQDQDQDDTHTIEDADPMDAEEDDDFNQSDDDQDDEGDQDGDQDADQDHEQDADQDNPDNDDDPTTRVDLPASTNNKTSSTINSPSNSSTPRFFRPTVRPEALSARLYDIVPTMAAPQATSINALAITPDLRYWMTGGSDGYVRKYDGPGTINGKQLLTVAQRHPFVDSVVKAGILMSYWENFEPLPTGADGRSRAGDDDKVLSPVYALAVHKDALWSLAGLESGGINIHSVRYDEGKVIHCLPSASGDHEGHTNAVSVLQLAPDEQNVLSGSWDKSILDWDLNTGNVAAKFDGSGSQISAIELRPMSGAPIPPEAAEEPAWASETFSSNSNARTNGFYTNGSHEDRGGTAADAPATEDLGDGPAGGGGAGSDHESLFGSPGGSLFGEGQMGGGGNAFGGDDDNEFSQAMLEPLEDAPADPSLGGDTAMTDAPPPPPSAPDPAPAVKVEEEPASLSTQPLETAQPPAETITTTMTTTTTQPDQPAPDQPAISSPTLVFNPPPPTSTDPTQTSSTTFLSASIDGTLRVWDRRSPTPLARIATRPGIPPGAWAPAGPLRATRSTPVAETV